MYASATEASPIRVGRSQVGHDADWTTISTPIDFGPEAATLRFRVRGLSPAPSGNAWLAACLLPAMKLGRRLCLDEPVSLRVLRGAGTIQEVFHCWDRTFQPIEVSAPPATPDGVERRGVACFFSGGVDSFYSVLKHLDEITHLIFLHGADVRLDDAERRERTSAQLRAAAAELGKPLVEVEVNLRQVFDYVVPWFDYFGAALACVAHLLAPHFGHVYIAGSGSYRELYPAGSHPLLDPHWSSESLEIVYDGAEAGRIDKVFRIAQHDVPLRYLRTCYEWVDDSANCARCGKCLRVMMMLDVAGKLVDCTTFPRPIDPEAVASMSLPSIFSHAHLREIFEAAERTGRDFPWLAAARQADTTGDARAFEAAQHRILELDAANHWLEQQRAAWEKTAHDQEQVIAELRAWVRDLQGAKAWLEEQLQQRQPGRRFPVI